MVSSHNAPADAPVQPAGAPAPADRDPDGRVKHVCFRLGEQEYAVDIAHIKETMMMVPITRVFLTPPWLAGIINLRGDIVAVIDLARFLGLPPTLVGDHSRIVVCRAGGRIAGMVVDEMAELRAIEAARIQPLPATITGESALLLSGVISVENDRALRVLDMGKLFESERLRAFQRKGNR